MNDRLKSASVILVSIFIIFGMDIAFTTDIFTMLLFAVVLMTGCIELLALAEKKKNKPFMKAILVFGPVFLFMSRGDILANSSHLSVIAVLAFVITLFILQVVQGGKDGLENISVTLFIFFYLIIMGSFIYRIRLLGNGADGIRLVIFFIATAKFSDAGAYFTGKTLGKHKLLPRLSPAKTVEGVVGGILASILFAVISARYLCPGRLSLQEALLFGLVISITAIFGDLIESMFKREAEVKDAGFFIPGMGGVLDILDSLILPAPLAWIILN